MKLMKKLSAVLLSLCLMVPCFSMVVSAADGRISFTDPSTAVGEIVEVKCVLRSTSGNMGDVEVELTYDEEYLRFKSGDSITDNGGGSLTCAGAATSAEVTFVAKFQALQEGSTKVGIASASIEDSNGASLTLDQGSSAVTIAAGDPSKIEEDTAEDTAEGAAPAGTAEDQQIDVNGVVYTLTDEFADADIPNGYARTQRNLDGVERQMVENETGTICLGYMRDADGVGDFFLYNEENATFSPYAEIAVSDMASIVVLSDSSQVSLPANYQEAKLSLNNKEFPVWQDTENEGMYVLYAMNGNGEACFYQYDSIEGTYQRFEPGVAAAEEEETDTSSILGKIQNFVEGHMAIVVLVVGLGGIIGLLVLIILAVKLHNRNAELDELYDEYGIDLEEEEVPAKKESKKSKKEAKKEAKKARKQPVEEDFEEEFEEFEEEEFEEFEEEEFEEFEEEEFEEFEEEEFEDYREAEYVSKQQPVEEFTGYTERMDFTIDDLDDLLEEKSGKKAGHMEDDDTFKMDFIDLD